MIFKRNLLLIFFILTLFLNKKNLFSINSNNDIYYSNNDIYIYNNKYLNIYVDYELKDLLNKFFNQISLKNSLILNIKYIDSKFFDNISLVDNNIHMIITKNSKLQKDLKKNLNQEFYLGRLRESLYIKYNNEKEVESLNNLLNENHLFQLNNVLFKYYLMNSEAQNKKYNIGFYNKFYKDEILFNENFKSSSYEKINQILLDLKENKIQAAIMPFNTVKNQNKYKIIEFEIDQQYINNNNEYKVYFTSDLIKIFFNNNQLIQENFYIKKNKELFKNK